MTSEHVRNERNQGGSPTHFRLDSRHSGRGTQMKEYDEVRPHSSKYYFGKTPMQTFIDSIALAKGKMLNLPYKQKLKHRNVRLSLNYHSLTDRADTTDSCVTTAQIKDSMRNLCGMLHELKSGLVRATSSKTDQTRRAFRLGAPAHLLWLPNSRMAC